MRTECVPWIIYVKFAASLIRRSLKSVNFFFVARIWRSPSNIWWVSDQFHSAKLHDLKKLSLILQKIMADQESYFYLEWKKSCKKFVSKPTPKNVRWPSLQLLPGAKLPNPCWAICTSATKVYASRALAMSGITIPDAFVAAEDVTAGKPAYVSVAWCHFHISTSYLGNADPIPIFWERRNVMSNRKTVSLRRIFFGWRWSSPHCWMQGIVFEDAPSGKLPWFLTM